jgi:hypothetical protein
MRASAADAPGTESAAESNTACMSDEFRSQLSWLFKAAAGMSRMNSPEHDLTTRGNDLTTRGIQMNMI